MGDKIYGMFSLDDVLTDINLLGIPAVKGIIKAIDGNILAVEWEDGEIELLNIDHDMLQNIVKVENLHYFKEKQVLEYAKCINKF